MKREKSPEHSETEELLKEISDKSNLDYGQTKILWSIMVDCMVDHLCVRFKSIDLGFAVIHPRPYRANWHNYMIQRFGALSQWVRGRSRHERDRILNESGALAEMQDSYLMAVRNGLMYLGLQIVPKRSWWRYMLHVQKRLLAAAGPVGYCRGIGRIVHKLRNRMAEAHLSHLHEIAQPCGRLHSGRYYGGNRYLAENRERKKVRPSAVPVRLGPLYEPNDPAEIVSTHADETVEKAPSGLLPMPHIQQKVIDVRDSSGGGGD